MINIEKKYTTTLSDLKSGKANLSEFLFDETNLAIEKIKETNFLRFRLLIAIYNSPDLLEEEMVYSLFKSEIVIAEKGFYWNFHSLQLAAYLNTINKLPEKILDFYRAKMANYDTFCMFEREFLFCQGIEETYHYLSTQTPDIEDKVLEAMGGIKRDSFFCSKEIKIWLDYKVDELSIFKYPKTKEETIKFAHLTRDKEIILVMN